MDRSAELALISRLKTGDEAAFRHLVRDQQRNVFRHCLHLTGNTGIAEDITQEVFLEIFRSIGRFRADAGLGTWIHRIAVNKCGEHHRATHRLKRGGSPDRTVPLDKADHWNLASVNPMPDMQLEREEEYRWLYECLDSINERQRTALILQQMDGLKQEDIARTMNISISAVESLLHRAKQSLRARMTESRPGFFNLKNTPHE